MQDQFKAGLKWLAANNQYEFEKALEDLVVFGTTGIEAKPDGSYRWVPMVEIMKIEKKEREDAARAN